MATDKATDKATGDELSLAEQHHEAYKAWLVTAEAYRDLSPALQASEAQQATVRAARQKMDELHQRIQANNRAAGFLYNI